MLFLIMGTVSYIAYTYPQSRSKINTNLNLMNTMLLGGLWHGASWNFVIWGGLNGIGIVLYKFWKKWNNYLRVLILLSLTLFFLSLSLLFSFPAGNIAAVWLSILLTGSIIRMIYGYLQDRRWIKQKYSFRMLGTVWAVLQTFVFISFTRLFFRSGSNLDPAEANQTAWNTAKNMVNQIGGSWNLAQIDAIVYEYRYVFSLIVVGMIIHWLPDKFKRRYRLLFAQMSLPAMIVFIVVSVFIIYQFITADLQKFIYFQF
ncbi:MAG: MBOAT family protein, partial [Dysgonamonadaceae bacterium]|jgi:D-alanyl-lipoteichoic acid acyltransferase DltB (MBOAT superfamily)|nr:MBOAT family protein [Dysgonamonadaceae bacterium]